MKGGRPVTKQNDLPDQAQWQSQAKKEAPNPKERGNWLVFTDSQGVGQALVQYLEDEGESCIQIFPGQSYQSLRSEQWYWLNPANCQDFYKLFQELRANTYPPCRGVLYLWSLDVLMPEEMSDSRQESAQMKGLTTLMHVIQGLHRCGWGEPPRLWVVTRDAQRIGPPVESLATQSSPWDLMRDSANVGQQRLWGGMIDLDPSAPCDEASLLFAEIWQPDGEDQIAFRHGQRFVLPGSS